MSTSTTTTNVHLLACVHGMWGSPAHLKSVEDTIQKKFPGVEAGTELATLRVTTNAESFTYDGLDWGAERAVKEIYAKVEELEEGGLKKVTRFSILGYSLGGLISRYAIGILYQRGFFNTIQPTNFTTIATPHIGLPRFRGVVGSAMHKLGPIMLSRTGRQFYCTDNDTWTPDAKEGRPLLEVMSDKDSIFFKALVLFPNMTIYGNAVHDLTVTYCSSMIEAHDPFTVLKRKSHRLAIKLDPKYKNVMQSFSEVPQGEVVPLTEQEAERRAARDAIAWYSPSRYKSGRPALPPFLQFPFPLNIIFYMLTPFLIPMGLTYAVIRFQRESRSSKRRLAELTASPEAESSLGAMLRRMEMAVAEVVDSGDPGVATPRTNGGWESDLEEGSAGADENQVKKRKSSRPETPEAGPNNTGATSLPSPLATPTITPSTNPLATKRETSHQTLSQPNPNDPDQPVLSPLQLSMIASLNSIPQLRKVVAYFPYVGNAHSVIVVRDAGNFPVHYDGMGVLLHWADRFVLA